MKIIFRPTKLSDINQMMQLNEKSLAENYQKEFWNMKFYEGKNHSFVAVWATLIIGYIFCDGDCIISFALDEKFRGKGVGRQLIHHCLNTYTNPVKLHVRVTNDVALKLYRSLGFVETETIVDYYTTPTENAYAMIWKPNGTKYEIKKKIIVT